MRKRIDMFIGIGLLVMAITVVPALSQETTPTPDPNLTPTVEQTITATAEEITATAEETLATLDVTLTSTALDETATETALFTPTLDLTTTATLTETAEEVTADPTNTETVDAPVTPVSTEVPGTPPEPTHTPVESGNSITGSALITETIPFSQELLEQLQLPEGFEISVFAQGLGNARMIAIDEDGTIYITRREQGDLIALFDNDGDGAADIEGFRVVQGNLPLLHGITIHEGTMYLSTDTDVYTAEILGPGQLGDLTPIITDLPDGGQHPNRTLAFGPDGLLYISVGSECNACPAHNPELAAILTAQADGSTRTVYASGLRNTIGFGWHPVTGEMWGMDHGTDWRGDNTPPEELNRLEAGANYGWPYCYGSQQPDVYVPAEPPGTTKEAFCATTTTPMLEYQAHSAPIGMIFYTGTQFPEEYQHDAFVAMRGSWNRSPATGYKLVRIRFDEDGQPIDIQDFVTGWLVNDGTAHFGRIAGVAQTADGSLLVTDDTNGVLYRITYTGN